MESNHHGRRAPAALFVALILLFSVGITTRSLWAQSAPKPASLEPGFKEFVQPFFQHNCLA